MPWRAPVGDIQIPYDGAEDVKAPCTVSLWDYYSNGYLWVHPSVVINIPPIYSASNISTTIQNSEGEVTPITVSPHVCLVGVDYGWLNSWVVPTSSVSHEGVHDFYR